MIPLDDAGLEALATTALAAVQREYPHMLIQELNSDADVLPPRRLNPAFYGCYDWHSAVHSHWRWSGPWTAGCPTPWPPPSAQVLDEHLSARSGWPPRPRSTPAPAGAPPSGPTAGPGWCCCTPSARPRAGRGARSGPVSGPPP